MSGSREAAACCAYKKKEYPIYICSIFVVTLNALEIFLYAMGYSSMLQGPSMSMAEGTCVTENWMQDFGWI